jgi:hypothetical protein
MEALGGEEVQLLLILDLGSIWGWVVSVTPRPRFTPGEKTPGTHCIGVWEGPRAGLDTEARGKFLCPCRGSNLNHPVIQSVNRQYTGWATPAPFKFFWLFINNTIIPLCIIWAIDSAVKCAKLEIGLHKQINKLNQVLCSRRTNTGWNQVGLPYFGLSLKETRNLAITV